MSQKLLCKNLDFISLISRVDSVFRNKLIQTASNEAIHTILDIIVNTLSGNIPMHQDLKAKLEKQKNILRFINNKTDKRIKVIRQKLLLIGKVVAQICENFLSSEAFEQLCQEENWN